MYTKEPKEQQYNIFQDRLISPLLDHEDPILKIAKTIDWTAIENKLSQFYCPDNGRPTKPSRAKVGLLILERLHKKSDVEVIGILKRDIYAQYLCNVSIDKSRDFLNPSSLCRFRKQIGLDGIKIIEDEIFKALKKAKLLKGRKLVCDTTVVPVNISYPTDVTLLEKIRRKAVEYLEQAKEFGAKHYRTYKRTARKVFIRFQKIRHHTVKSRRKVQKKLRQFAARNVQQLKEAARMVKDTMQTVSGSAKTSLEKAKEQFVGKAENFLNTASVVILQQKEIYRGITVKERIVSPDKPHIRPMVRGKYPVEVEFGPKILVNLKNNLLFLEDLRFNNVSDTHLLERAIQAHQERFGNYPSQLAADRGFWSKENFAFAQDKGIAKIAIENKGKSNYLKGKSYAERLRRLRCAIEAKISLAKRKYGLDRARYSIPSGEEIWIRLGLMTMNLKACVDSS